MSVIRQFFVLFVTSSLFLAACSGPKEGTPSPAAITKEPTSFPTSATIEDIPTLAPVSTSTSIYADWNLPEQTGCHKTGDSKLYLNVTKQEYRGCLLTTTQKQPFQLVFKNEIGTTSITVDNNEFKDSTISLLILRNITNEGIWFRNETVNNYVIEIKPLP